MSSAYTLALANPAITTPPVNVVYTGVTGGNTLNLTIGNNTEFPMTIGGSSMGKYLLIQISSNIIDAGGAGQIKVGAPWQIAGVLPPSSLEQEQIAGGFSSLLKSIRGFIIQCWAMFTGEKGTVADAAPAVNYYTLQLLPPSTGVTIPNSGTITLTLSGFSPVATGMGTVGSQYQFDSGDNFNLNSSLSVTASNTPELKDLFGDGAPLRFGFFVNTGSADNPVMVSSAPITTDNAVENSLKVNFLYQEVMLPGIPSNSDGNLVETWDPAKPPTFRIFFPCLAPGNPQPATTALTDCLKPGDKGYNSLTSAWNITGSFDPQNPSVTQNSFWQISMDPVSTDLPVWMIQPTSANTHLFTAVQSNSNEPGIYLNLFFSHIFSALPIDSLNPVTNFYLQWNDFPGFNEGISAFTLQKQLLAITKFTCVIVSEPTGYFLEMSWSTANASSCTISGSTQMQAPNTPDSEPYKVKINADTPLRAEYTLTAIGGNDQVTRTVKAVWQLAAGVQANVSAGGRLSNSPDLGKLLMLNAGNSNAILSFNYHTLQQLSSFNVAGALHLTTTIQQPQQVFTVNQNGSVSIYNLQGGPPSNSVAFSGANLPPFAQIGLSAGGDKVILPVAQENGIGANQLVVLDSVSLQPIAGSPFALPAPPISMATNFQSGNVFIGMIDRISGFQGSNFKPLPLPQVSLNFPALLVSTQNESTNDKKRLYALSVVEKSGAFSAFLLSKIHTKTMQVELQTQLDPGFIFYNVNSPLYAPFASMVLSPDNKYLFLSGLTTAGVQALQGGQPGPYEAKLVVFDTSTLQEHSWSPIMSAEYLPCDLCLSPDGSQLFALNGNSIGNALGGASMSMLSPSFQ